MTLLRIAVLALLTQAAALQQPPSASIQGVMREANTGKPLENVTLELRRLDAPAPYVYSLLTSVDGAFEFRNIVPGDYRLTAKRPGYFSWEYGQHGWNGSGAPIHIAAGESKKNIRFQLTPGGSISGRITDKDGDTGAVVMVQAIAVSNRTGHRTYQVVQNTFTNDLGEYRFFELHPGKYLLSATNVESSTRLDFFPNNTGASLLNSFTTLGITTSGLNPGNGPAPVFYPGTSDPRAASEIEVTPGAAVRGGNFAVFPVQTRHVRGIVQGQGTPQVQLIARTPAPGFPASIRSMNAASGAFDLGDVAPGEYLLIAQWVDQKATMKVDVHDADISNLILELRPGILVPAHVRIAGRATAEPDPANPYIKFNLTPDPEIEALPIPTIITFPDGSVNFHLMPGENYRISLANVPGAPAEFQNLYIQSIRMGTHDVLNDGLHFTGEDDARIEVVMGTGAGSLTGTVVDDRDASINTSVVLVPDMPRRGRADAYKTATTDAAGRFQIGQIPPGDYLAFAWEEVEDGEWRDPDFIRQYEGRGAPIHIEESGKASVALQVIP